MIAFWGMDIKKNAAKITNHSPLEDHHSHPNDLWSYSHYHHLTIKLD
jgi:hypothetical protein